MDSRDKCDEDVRSTPLPLDALVTPKRADRFGLQIGNFPYRPRNPVATR